jgi:hypothetical protein
LGKERKFFVDLMEYPATGGHGAPIPQKILKLIKEYNLILAMTEYSASSSIGPLCNAPHSKLRCASMPGVEPRMEETAFMADYSLVKKYANGLTALLNKSSGANILFSTGDSLYIDLRNRLAEADDGDCRSSGTFINFPSGESYKSPYEGTLEERAEFGKSKTEGVMPLLGPSEV